MSRADPDDLATAAAEPIPGALIVIAKTPRPGLVKTRLTPPLSADEALAVAWACLEDTLAAAAAVSSTRHVLLLAGEPGGWVPDGFEVIPQVGGGLADRLIAGFEAVADDAIVIAMDTPQVEPASLARALRALGSTHDSVFGPAADGGYWLLGLRRDVSKARVLDGIPMSTDHTGAAQLHRLESLGLTTLTLETLRDVDDVDDLLVVGTAHPSSRLGRLLPELATAATSRRLWRSRPLEHTSGLVVRPHPPQG